MCIYYKEKPENFSKALESIWMQSLRPDEIVIVEDGPLTVELNDVLIKWRQIIGRDLKIISLPKNMGQGYASNIGLNSCIYNLVARMDSDDISISSRFEKQVSFMTANQDVSVSSGTIEEYDQSMNLLISKRTLPLSFESIIKFSKRRSPINNPCVIYRRDDILAIGGYTFFGVAEDYALWSTLLSKGYKFRNIPDVLLRMRLGDALKKRRGFNQFKEECRLLRYQRDINFITAFDFFLNLSARFIFRVLSPYSLKLFFYKVLR